MNWLEHVLGKEWNITPAGGSTGEAYYAQYEAKRLFLKRNSSPFLAVLSAQGIVPKLVWTKRMENGDVITAQQWLEGRELSTEEMKQVRVAKLLSKIHHSTELLDLLMRMGKRPLLPETLLAQLRASKKYIMTNLKNPFEIQQAFAFLEKMLPNVHYDRHVVCHSDVNHNNWLLANCDQLYLIDWDNAMVADPAMDIGMLLHWYIPENDWKTWLSVYGIDYTDHLLMRMHWYAIAQTLSFIEWHMRRNEEKQAAHWMKNLKRLMVNIGIIKL